MPVRIRGGLDMPTHPFVFDSVIYNAFDNVRDGIGNHLSLFDRLIFTDLPARKKSLSPVDTQAARHRYGKVPANLHLEEPRRFKNALFLDLARETWDADRIRDQVARTVRHKRVFNAVTAVYLMWESDRLWSAYADMISAYDFCIVTSDLLAEFLDARGIDWLKLPHPYDFERVQPRRPRDRSGPVRFGISAGLWQRKNVSVLASDFTEVFGKDPGVELSIHTRSDPLSADFRDEFEAIERMIASGARIELISEALSREDYLEWMASLDVYCFVSAGEGYSVTPREALHLSVPVLLHDAHVHREFSHLPGVVRVPSAGRQVASPNTSGADFDIGSDWRIDREALRDALRHCRNHHESLRAELVDRYREVLDFHDIASVRAQWIEALNARYSRHVDDVRLNYPGVLEYPLKAHAFEDLDLSLAEIHSGTGWRRGDCVICLAGEHEPGHCVYGPYLAVSQPGRYAVVFHLDVLSKTLPDEVVALDVYDGAADEIIAVERVTADRLQGLHNEFRLAVDLDASQVLEARVYWFGDSNICVSALRVEPIG